MSDTIKNFMRHIVATLSCAAIIAFLFLTELLPAWKYAGAAAAVVLLGAYCFFEYRKNEMFSKLAITCLMLGVLFSGMLFILYKINFFEYVKDQETLRAYIASFGNYAVVVFFLIQFMQVIVAPIPGPLVIMAGSLLFEQPLAAIISYIAIASGSVVAFLIGRVFGIKLVRWIVGEESLKKGLELVKGKDRIAITLMFLFPFFPDDLLCFIAGLTTMSFTYFIVMNCVARLLTVGFTSFFLVFAQSMIAQNLVLGILLTVLVVVCVAIVFYFSMKNADKIDEWISNFSKRRKNTENGK